MFYSRFCCYCIYVALGPCWFMLTFTCLFTGFLYTSIYVISEILFTCLALFEDLCVLLCTCIVTTTLCWDTLLDTPYCTFTVCSFLVSVMARSTHSHASGDDAPRGPILYKNPLHEVTAPSDGPIRSVGSPRHPPVRANRPDSVSGASTDSLAEVSLPVCPQAPSGPG